MIGSQTARGMPGGMPGGMIDDPVIEAIPAALLAEPLNWLFAEHYRHRQLCALIERIGSASLLLHEEIDEALAFLRRDLPIHVIDEEDDLFPLLRRRCSPDDDLGRTLGILSAEHRQDMDASARLIEIMQEALRTGRPPGGDLEAKRRFTDFAAQECRHIALENAVVLPIARLRLTAHDLAGLSRRMAARRGLAVFPAAAEAPAA